MSTLGITSERFGHRSGTSTTRMQAARTLFDAAAPLLAKRGATKEQRREDFLHLRTHWLETD